MNPSYWFILHHDGLILPKATNSLLITDHLLPVIQPFLTRTHLLGHFNQHDVYCAEFVAHHALPSEFSIMPLRKALEVIGEEWYTLAVKAYSIINWDKNHQYCGRCGHLTQQKINTFERICESCTQVFYPRISPSVIALIHKNDQILMARSPHFAPGVYGLIAGFIEAGESAETALHREVAEEVGITIHNLQYFGSQAWPFPDSLMIGFVAEHLAGEIVIDNNEIETAGWFHMHELPGRPSTNISLAAKLLDSFIAKHRN